MILQRKPTRSIYEIKHNNKHFAFTMSGKTAYIIKCALIQQGGDPHRCMIGRKQFYSTYVNNDIIPIL